MGQAIAEHQKFENFEKSIVERIDHDLQIFYLGIRGFSDEKLWRMRLFYKIYCSQKNSHH
ncbi:DUF1016 N-terminal domain-containing protein [Candidatus Coxiella mudrowiae]|uniref:DUF1016 N-terminal domain-containing protein n=1 Tax=Candidatus Coxiella mudrowiae TaxID=2054173 RepID=UPI00190FD054